MHSTATRFALYCIMLLTLEDMIWAQHQLDQHQADDVFDAFIYQQLAGTC